MALQNKVIVTALSGIAKWLTSAEAWASVKATVQAMAGSSNMSGEEKRAAVVAAIQETGWQFANWALNLLIEIAVVVVTDRLEHAIENEKQ